MYNYDRAILDDYVFNFIYGCALHDAVLQKAYKGERKWIEEVAEAKSAVKAYINQIISGDLNDKTKHDNVFLETAKKVCKEINNFKDRPDSAGDFHFGNAQKLINMTVKHVYAHTYSIHLASGNSSSIRKHFQYCHCPMDSIMLERVWAEYKDRFKEDKVKKDLGNNFRKAWGAEDFEANGDDTPHRYEAFQTAIKNIINPNQNIDDNLYPIEYDYIAWKAHNKNAQEN